MVLVAFNKNYRDKELNREVKAGEPVEMTVKRADDIVKNIQGQAKKFPAYKEFNYVRVEDAKEDPAKTAEGEKENKKDVKEEK